MLAIISDLHLQHTSRDGVRYRLGDKIVQMPANRNVNVGALQRFFSMIHERVERCRVKELHLVFAGDIFEIHRSPLWLAGGCELRPYLPVQTTGLHEKVAEILEAIGRDNKDCCDALRAFVRKGAFTFHDEAMRFTRGRKPRIAVHYVPGNHDRLLNAWDDVRATARGLLCMDANVVSPFPHVLDWPTASDGSGYGVRVRHGHEYDSSNFGVAPHKAGGPAGDAHDVYLRPCVGDYMTVDVAMRLALAFRARYACELRDPGRTGVAYRSFYRRLTDFDDVRPMSLWVDYLVGQGGPAQATNRDLLAPLLEDMAAEAGESRFLRGASGLGAATGLLGLIQSLGSGVSIWALDKALGGVGRADVESPDTTVIARELEKSRDLHTLVAGHTHFPRQRELGAVRPGADDPRYFIDTGTWRTVISKGLEGYGRLRAYTMVFCYSDAERARFEDDERRFETWTGSLLPRAAGDAPPDGVRASGPDATVAFTSCKVISVDEGNTANGAELRLHFGVDDEGCTFTCKGVHNGDDVVLPGMSVTARPQLDGELWFHGVEVDLGSSVIDRDDPLPWAIGWLERKADGSFAKGANRLEATGRGMRLILNYDVA